MEIRRATAIKQGEDVVGNHTKIKAVKNKVAPPFKQVELDIMYGEGISLYVGKKTIDLGIKAGIVEKAGAWTSYDSTRLGQGRENSKQFCVIILQSLMRLKEKFVLPQVLFLKH